MELNKLKNEVAYFMRRLYAQRLTTTLGGNISLKISPDNILITPSGIDKGTITGEQIGELRIDGTNLTPALKPSMETPMHLAIYAARPDVKTVLHAHPVTASTFAASNRKINCRLIAESRLFLGEVFTAPYACMGTADLAESAVNALSAGNNAILMANHGALTVGESLLQAFDRMEVLESAAKITLMASLLGNENELNEMQLKQIDCLLTS
ncbi:MAG: class II aldolase/adducin family protein [Desulfobacterales bacterium]|jgi:L-fuculose-phosphate aldolase|nr:class II aldolase/adducin family protein [Desulfobacterales bacterium]